MKASEFLGAQKAFVLRQAEDGVPIAEVCSSYHGRTPHESGGVLGAQVTSGPESRRKMLLLREVAGG